MSHILSPTVQRRLLAPLSPWQRLGRSHAACCTNNTPVVTGRDRIHKTFVAPAFLIKPDATRHPRLIYTDGKSWVLGLLCALALTSSACNTQNPNAPTRLPMKNTPSTSPDVLTATMQPICADTAHNLPITFEGQETGPIYYVCATQPREYMDADGQNHTMEVDHYLSVNRCPTTPIS
jgi:hypothetical protein